MFTLSLHSVLYGIAILLIVVSFIRTYVCTAPGFVCTDGVNIVLLLGSLLCAIIADYFCMG